MKKLKLFILFAVLVAPLFGVQAAFIVTFNPPADATNEVEYVVEEKVGDTWVEVARGDGFSTGESAEVGLLGIKFSKNVPFGLYTVRLYTWVKNGSIPREVETDTSAPTSVMVRPGKPTLISLVSNRS